MSARRIDLTKFDEKSVPGLLVSADSHVYEPLDLWDGMPAKLKAQLPAPRPVGACPPGGLDPKLRVVDMDRDGVAAEVIYPTSAMAFYHLDQAVQEAAFTIYNDWIADYCKASPKRLYAIAQLPTHDIGFAVNELRRCRDMGLIGGMVWRVPHPDLPFTHPTHYEPLWAAAAEWGMPISLHTLTGHCYRMKQGEGIEYVRGPANLSTIDGMQSMYDLIWSGVCDRHPGLRFVMVESEIGWLPFTLQMWDYCHRRYGQPSRYAPQHLPSKRPPSEVFGKNFSATFMDDFVGSKMLAFWGENNCMWSSDYPHPNMTWPTSRAFIAKNLGDLPMEKKKKLASQNVIDLYDLKL
jgi:predicted TIM-barrel fold metal-dependent hydrolase